MHAAGTMEDNDLVAPTTDDNRVVSSPDTCYASCQVKRLSLGSTNAITKYRGALRCVPNAYAALDSIFDIQVWLKCNGLYRTGPLSGEYGPQTRAAISAVKMCLSLAYDGGIVSDGDRAAMRKTSPAALSKCSGMVRSTGPQRTRRGLAAIEVAGAEAAGDAARTRRAGADEYECQENANFKFDAGTTDHQRWFVCNNFLRHNHPMDGRLDPKTLEAIRTLQHHTCMSPVTGVVTPGLTSIMRKWFPGFVHPNCGKLKKHGSPDATPTPPYKCKTDPGKFPLNTIYEHKIYFKCMGTVIFQAAAVDSYPPVVRV